LNIHEIKVVYDDRISVNIMIKAVSYLLLSFSKQNFIQRNEATAKKLLSIIEDKNSDPLIIQIEGSKAGGKTLIVDTFRQVIFGGNEKKTKYRKDHLNNRDFEFYHGQLNGTDTPITFFFNSPNISTYGEEQPLKRHIWRKKHDSSRKLADIYMVSNLEQTRLAEQVNLYQTHLQDRLDQDTVITPIKPDIKINLTAYGPLFFWVRRMDLELFSERVQQAIPQKPKVVSFRKKETQELPSLAA